MVRRAETQSFMPGVWVFPGGASSRARSPRRCAARELEEETGIELGEGAELRAWSRWITPEVVPVRFDTHFFVGLAPAHTPPRPDGGEVDEAGWFTPRGALRASRTGRAGARLPDDQDARDAAALRERRARSSPRPASGSSSRSCRGSSAPARTTVCCCPASDGYEDGGTRHR